MVWIRLRLDGMTKSGLKNWRNYIKSRSSIACHCRVPPRKINFGNNFNVTHSHHISHQYWWAKCILSIQLDNRLYVFCQFSWIIDYMISRLHCQVPVAVVCYCSKHSIWKRKLFYLNFHDGKYSPATNSDEMRGIHDRWFPQSDQLDVKYLLRYMPFRCLSALRFRLSTNNFIDN